MKLTGKAQEKFEEWLFEQPKFYCQEHLKHQWLSEFYSLPDSMQWGIYQDWADSMGFDLCVFWDERYDENDNSKFELFWSVSKIDMIGWDGYCKTRQEARDAAIEKLNQIINEQ